MSEFGQFSPQVSAMQEALAGDPLPRSITNLVRKISVGAAQWGPSPVGCVNVVAGVLVAAAVGMAGAIGGGGLSITDVDDRDDLRTAVIALRTSADVLEAIVKAGQS